MSPLQRADELVKEAAASSKSHPVVSIATILVVATMCIAVLLTSGKAVGAQQAVLNTLDNAGTRSIVVRASPDSGLDSSVVDRLRLIEGIDWVAAFSAGNDVSNALLPGAPRVAIRTVWSSDFPALGMSGNDHLEHTAWASSLALSALGIGEGVGSVEADDGTDFDVRPADATNSAVAFLEPLLLLPGSATEPGDVSYLIVVADSPDVVGVVSDATLSMLDVADRTKVEVSTSEELAELRNLIEGQLGTFGRGLTLSIFGLMGVLVAAALSGLVLLRRKDFGRRRALGASQRLIVALLLAQTALLAGLGAILGTAVGFGSLLLGGDPLPSWTYALAVGLLAIAVASIAALAPAAFAARREPLNELRVP